MESSSIDEGYALFESGVQLSSFRRHRLDRLLREAIRRSLGAPAVARLLCRAIRQQRDDDPDGPVGRNVMCAVIMRGAPPGDPNYVSGSWPLSEDAKEAEYFHLPADNPPSKYYFYVPGEAGDLIHDGPNSSCVGVQMKDVLFVPEGAPENRQSECNRESPYAIVLWIG